jgi:hypothetical protein
MTSTWQVLVPKEDAEEFEELINKFAPGILAGSPSGEPEAAGLELVRFLIEHSDSWLSALVLGYWLGKSKRLVIDDNGIHILVKTPQRLIKAFRAWIEKGS